MNLSVLDMDVLFKDMTKRNGRWSELACELAKVKQQAKAIALIESELTEELKELSEGVASYDHNGYTYKPYDVKGSIDVKTAQKELGIDLEQYRKASFVTWRFGKAK